MFLKLTDGCIEDLLDVSEARDVPSVLRERPQGQGIPSKQTGVLGERPQGQGIPSKQTGVLGERPKGQGIPSGVGGQPPPLSGRVR